MLTDLCRCVLFVVGLHVLAIALSIPVFCLIAVVINTLVGHQN